VLAEVKKAEETKGDWKAESQEETNRRPTGDQKETNRRPKGDHKQTEWRKQD
jgi:hypothetical protein